MRITSTVKIDNRFGALERGYDRTIASALQHAAAVGAEVSRSAAQARSESGEMSHIRTTGVRPDRRGLTRGYDIAFYSPAFYAQFQELGTLSARKKKLKQPSRNLRSGGGIKPLRFMAKGRTAARRALLLELQRRL